MDILHSNTLKGNLLSSAMNQNVTNERQSCVSQYVASIPQAAGTEPSAREFATLATNVDMAAEKPTLDRLTSSPDISSEKKSAQTQLIEYAEKYMIDVKTKGMQIAINNLQKNYPLIQTFRKESPELLVAMFALLAKDPEDVIRCLKNWKEFLDNPENLCERKLNIEVYLCLIEKDDNGTLEDGETETII